MEENNNVEKKGILNKILIVIIIILMLMLGGLSYYTFFVRDNTKVNDNKTTDNNTDKEEETNEQEQTDTSLYKEDGNYIYTKDAKKEDLVIEALLGKVEKSVNDMTKEEWQQFILTRAIVFTEYKEIVPTSSCDNTKPDTDTKNSMACILGMSDEEINKADLTIFENVFGGSTRYISYPLEDIKAELVKVYGSYGNMFDNSIGYLSSTLDSGIFYDKNIDKVFIHYLSAPTIGVSGRYIVNKTLNTDSYVVEYFDYSALENLSDINGNVIAAVDDISNIEKLVEKNISKFPKKIVTFKLVDGVYKYDSEKDA